MSGTAWKGGTAGNRWEFATKSPDRLENRSLKGKQNIEICTKQKSLREGAQEKNPGKVFKKTNFFLKKIIFQWACWIIPEPQKHVLHLVWSAYFIYTAIKTALKARGSRILGKRRPVLWRKLISFWNGTKPKIRFGHYRCNFEQQKMGVNFFFFWFSAK